MVSLGFSNLVAGLIFGAIGLVAFMYGKRMNLWRPMFLGIALMAFPYLVETTVWLYLIGLTGTAALFFLRD